MDLDIGTQTIKLTQIIAGSHETLNEMKNKK